MEKNRNIFRHEKNLLALLNTLFLTEKISPELKHIVVTKVNLTSDFYVAKVYIDSASKKSDHTLELLKQHEYLIKRQIASNLSFKKIPSFEWKLDKDKEHIEKMDEIFKKINKT